jgi:hypothetical protein
MDDYEYKWYFTEVANPANIAEVRMNKHREVKGRGVSGTLGEEWQSLEEEQLREALEAGIARLSTKLELLLLGVDYENWG